MSQEFIGSNETIERFLHSSYDQFAGRATIPNFLPLLAERFTRHASPHWPESKARSPTPNRPCCSSAPTTPAAPRWRWDSSTTWPEIGGSPGRADQNQAMTEVGIDITGEFPKPWTDEIVEASDIVITMGCGDACPVFPGHRY